MTDLWHLGVVNPAYLARFDHPVVEVDSDWLAVEELNHGHALLHEPRLDDLISKGLATEEPSFTLDREPTCLACEVLWVAYDTSVNEQGESGVDDVLRQIQNFDQRLS